MPKFRRSKTYVNTWLEIGVRIILAIIFLELEKLPPFKRKIHSDEMWLYRNPRTDSYVPSAALWPLVLGVPFSLFLLFLLLTRNKLDFLQAHLAMTLALGLNGVLTDALKLAVGRPRPDFFWRCFPDGVMNNEMACTGEAHTVMDGRKSFPSGHSSFSFTAMSFISFYLMGKLHVFSERGRGQSWRICLTFAPLLVALLVAVSRTCDYHHHWQDVTCGSLIGLSISYLCYRQYFPPLNSKLSHRSYLDLIQRHGIDLNLSSVKTSSTSTLMHRQLQQQQLPQENTAFLEDEKETKWI